MGRRRSGAAGRPDLKLAAARVRAVEKFPYLASVVLSLRPVERQGIGTIAVDDGLRLWVDPARVVDLDVRVLSAVLLHEACHALRRHADRRGSREAAAWNLAGCIAINDDLIAAGETLPGSPVEPASLGLPGELTEESYYGLLTERREATPGPSEGGAGGEGSEARDEGSGQGESSRGQRRPTLPGEGCCGGCAGNPFPWEADPGSRDDPGAAAERISAGEQEVLRRLVAREVERAVRGRGTVPAGLRLWAEAELRPPVVDWRRELAHWVRTTCRQTAGALDYSYARPGRRYPAFARAWHPRKPPVLPALRAYLPDVGVVLDTSGSVEGDLGEAFDLVLGLVRALGGEVTVYAGDTRLAAKGKVRSACDLPRLARGGGGTDMAALWRAARKTHDLYVLLTDGRTPWPGPEEVAGKRLLVVLFGDAVGRVPEHLPVVQAGGRIEK